MLKDVSEFCFGRIVYLALNLPLVFQAHSGGAFMNAGAYDGEMSHVVTAVRAVDFRRNIKEYDASHLTLLIVIVYSTIIMKLLEKSLYKPYGRHQPSYDEALKT